MKIYLESLLLGMFLGGFVVFGAIHFKTFSTPYDCVEDYTGYVVADRNYGGEYILRKGCKDYVTVSFAAIDDKYSVGDTIGKKKFSCSEYWAKRYEELENKYIELNETNRRK